jgi:hypothetical protein
MNKTDSFEAIAADAVELLTSIAMDLGNSESDDDKAGAAIITLVTMSLCERAIALGAE